MSIDIVSHAARLWSVGPGLPRPTLGLSRLLDAGMGFGSLAAILEPNWVGITGLVVAAGSILVKLRDGELRALKAQNEFQARQIAWLDAELGAIRDPGGRPAPPRPTQPTGTESAPCPNPSPTNRSDSAPPT